MRHILPLTLTLGLAAGCVLPPAVTLPAAAPSSNVFSNTASAGSGDLRTSTTRLVMMSGDTKDMNSLVQRASGGTPTQTVVWTSNNDVVAAVSANSGVVQADRIGTALITGRLSGDPASAVTIEVTVVEKHSVLLVKVDPATPKITVGQSLKLKAEVTMADGQINGNVSWSSSDNTIAVINPTTGEVSALREGKVTIMAAYSAEPRYRGLAELEIVKDLKETPVPSPSNVVFGPSATPIPASPTPKPTDTPTPRPSQAPSSGETASGEDAVGKTAGGGVSFTAPSFAAVRTFSSGWVVEMIDFRRVVVAEGTKLTITTNGGRNWTVYNDVGTQPIRAMHWLSETEGWVAGDNGTILNVSINNGELATTVQDSKTTSQIRSIFFTSGSEGFFSTQDRVMRTSDGGATWGEPVEIYVGFYGGLGGDGLGGARLFSSSAGRLFHHRDGGFVRITVGDRDSFSAIDATAGVAVIRRGYERFTTTDWNTFTPFPTELKTSTQIVRDPIQQLVPISPSTFMAVLSGPKYMISRDGGKLWSDPKEASQGLDWHRAFSEDQLWGVSGNTLYRAGTP